MQEANGSTFESGDSLSSGVTHMSGKALPLFSLLLPRDTHLASATWHNWTADKTNSAVIQGPLVLMALSFSASAVAPLP